MTVDPHSGSGLDQPLALFTSGGFISGSVMKNVLLATSVSLSIMYLLILLGLPVMFIVILLLLTLFLVLRKRSGRVLYSIYSWGIEQRISPSLSPKKELIRRFLWSDVLSYKSGSDLNRSFVEYNYLRINLNKAPHVLQMTDSQAGTEAFLLFLNTFTQQIDQYNSGIEPVQHKTEGLSQEVTLPHKPIKKRRDFYQTFAAKFVTTLFLFVTLFLLWYAFTTDTVRASNLFRIFFILVPGTAYMLYRVFYRKGN